MEPVEYVLGVCHDVCKNKTTGLYSQVPVNDKCIYVPILGTLESMFTNSELCHFFQLVKTHQYGIYKDINDGSYFKKHMLFGQKEHAL